MRKEYDKLVRDYIPKIIRQEGGECEIEEMSEEEYRQALMSKLLEEAEEVTKSSSENLTEELADLLEVINAIVETYGIENEVVIAEQKQRRTERGGFKKRIKLLWSR